jgi:hypothetical protein
MLGTNVGSQEGTSDRKKADIPSCQEILLGIGISAGSPPSDSSNRSKIHRNHQPIPTNQGGLHRLRTSALTIENDHKTSTVFEVWIRAQSSYD